ncbi:hypothetical protein ABZ897_00775 [Nonomuraea sp. NPDC046802]|uniref:hypothetical protein n=1 Tax=Nonomuraea sp. NPDC046802 TaxID=3154919 RepID=UPI0033C3B182
MREEYDPDVHGSYGEWLRSKNLQTRPQGWTHATHDQAREYVGKDGKRVKDVTDQLGNRVVQHGRDQQSVIARPQTVTAQIPASALKRGTTDVQQR